MPDSISPSGKTPFDIHVGAPDAAGSAFQATLVSHVDSPVFPKCIDSGRTEVKAGLLPAIPDANLGIENPQMWGCIDLEPVEKKLVFNCCHFTLLQASNKSLISRDKDILCRIVLHIRDCFFFLSIPSTVSISLAAMPEMEGKMSKISSRYFCI